MGIFEVESVWGFRCQLLYGIAFLSEYDRRDNDLILQLKNSMFTFDPRSFVGKYCGILVLNTSVRFKRSTPNSNFSEKSRLFKLLMQVISADTNYLCFCPHLYHYFISVVNHTSDSDDDLFF